VKPNNHPTLCTSISLFCSFLPIISIHVPLTLVSVGCDTQVSTNIQVTLFYALCFTWFCFNTPCQFIPLLNSCPHILCLMPFGWLCTTMQLRVYKAQSTEQGLEAVHSLETAPVSVQGYYVHNDTHERSSLNNIMK
jgi:hypothetical protein